MDENYKALLVQNSEFLELVEDIQVTELRVASIQSLESEMEVENKLALEHIRLKAVYN